MKTTKMPSTLAARWARNPYLVLILLIVCLPVSLGGDGREINNRDPSQRSQRSYHPDRPIRADDGLGNDSKKVLISSYDSTPSMSIKNQQGQSLKTCHYYNETACNAGKQGLACKNPEQQCYHHQDTSHDPLCYVLWEAKSATEGDRKIKLSGCWVGRPEECHEQDRCVEKRNGAKRNLFFCCCSGNQCNEQFFHEPSNEIETVESSAPPDQPSPSIEVVDDTANWLRAFLAIVAFCIMSILSVVLYTRFIRPKRTHFDSIPTHEDGPEVKNHNDSYMGIALGLFQSREEKAQGRFGCIYKAVFSQGVVAVKVFPTTHFTSWDQECKIYRLPQMKHENILSFIGSDRTMAAGQDEYWLVTEYIDRGSLYDYLKAEKVSFNEMLHIAEGIARGLNRLHEELPAKGREGSKPTVAHRDFKSKNVLLKPDLTACIADFGLALVFDSNGPLIEALGQVGTRRYMAPEVLEGAISFSRNSLLAIDMYACGLVLWELASRCSRPDGPVPSYKLPFEEEVGLHPSLEDMQEVVSQQKKRPVIQETWKNHSGLNHFCETIADLWDQEAEARITASCLEVRIQSLRSGLNPFAPSEQIPDITQLVRMVGISQAGDDLVMSYAHSPLLINETCT